MSRRDADRDRVVGATLTLLASSGLRKLTMADISRASGVPRATLYTHFSSKSEVLAAVLVAELGEFMAAVEAGDRPQDSAEERLVAAICATVRRLRGHVVLRRLLMDEPDVILPLLVTNDEVLQLARAYTEQRLREVADPTMADPTDAAEFIIRVLSSLMLFGGSHYDLDNERQVAELVRRWVIPIVFSA